MSLLTRFQRYIKDNQLLTERDRVLLAVSGGRDSMLMASLFSQTSYQFAIAHCNFGLRGTASDQDEILVRKFCKENNIIFFVNHFDTAEFAKKNGISIQMAARELRYSWFDYLAEENNFDAIAIAQHHDDQIETLFVNLFRGTGIRGLHGIRPKSNKYIRPLLFLQADEVLTSLKKYDIPYRDDQSNFSTDYLRNKIRLNLVPVMREISSNFEDTMRKNISYFREEKNVFEQLLENERKCFFREEKKWICIDKSILSKYTSNLAVLFQLFKPYGFSKGVLQNLLDQQKAQPGLIFESAFYELLLDRQKLFLRKKTPAKKDTIFLLKKSEGTLKRENYNLQWSIIDDSNFNNHPDIAMVDAEKLQFPLSLRKWQEGDAFHPLGMNGQKKLSDFFIDKKFSRFEKEEIEVLVNKNGEIIWIIGVRLDNRYKIEENTKKVCKFVLKR